MKALHCGGISSLSCRDQEQQAGTGRAQGQEALQTSPPPQEGFCGAAHSHLAAWVCQDGQEHQDTLWENQDSSHWLQGHKLEKTGCGVASAPFSAAPTEWLH